MRRVLTMLTAVLLLAGALFLTASAESAASSVDMLCSVNSDGDCLVSMTVMFRLEEAYSDMTFPLPPNAKNITMNGASVSATRSEASADVNISKITRDYIGDAVVRFEYTIPSVARVAEDRKQLQMDIPLLSGFRFPVEMLSFAITMPSSEMPNRPTFTSIYRGSSIESDLKWEIRSSQIIGSSTTAMNDHEGVTLHMMLPFRMFPGVSTYIREGNPELTPMLIVAGVALLYWLLFLRALPLIPEDTGSPPAGISAGELGCRLTQAGADLTAMIFHWGQLGYVLIHMDGNDRVLIHKRMEMGNERSQFENKVFKLLFGGRRVVDATGRQYALLCQEVERMTPRQRSMFRTTSGNVAIFRAIACVSQMICGYCVAMNMSNIRGVQVVLAVLLVPLGLTAWAIQGAAYRTHLRGKMPILTGFVLIALWTLLGVVSGQIWIPLGCSVVELLLGYFAAYGGRRSDIGRHEARLVLGLRQYLKRLPNEEASRLMKNDPDFFFNMAPYALALGVIKPFSRSFSRRKLDQCPYLMTEINGKRTGEDWALLMLDAAALMDEGARNLRYERIRNLLTRRLPSK